LEFGDGFEFAEGSGFDRFGFGGIEDGFEFLFLAVQTAHGLGVVECEAALLNPGMAFEGHRFSGGGINQAWQAELLAVDYRDFGHEIDGVDRVLGRIILGLPRKNVE
jgi:hypothetical protein